MPETQTVKSTLHELRTATAARNSGPAWFPAESLATSQTHWLWYPYLANEHINIIAGMGNEGKGLVCIDIAARVSRGRAFPETPEKTIKGHVLWCEMEDDIGSTIIPRLHAAGADLREISILNPNFFLKTSDISKLAILGDAIREKKPRLVVLSPMNSFLGSININKETEVREVFEKLRLFCEGHDCAILGIAHANKNTEVSSIERISGSVTYVNFCRSVVFVKTENADKGSRRFIHGKWNMSKKGSDLLYTPTYVGSDPKERDQFVRVTWEGALSDINHQKAFSAEMNDSDNTKETAGEWLLRTMQEKQTIQTSELKLLAKASKYRMGTIEAARYRFNNRYEDFTIESTSHGTWTYKRR